MSATNRDRFWTVMTADARQTVDELADSGFAVVETRIGSMASGLIRLSGEYLDVVIARDRGQWMMTFIVDDESLDLDAVIATRIDQETWSAPRREEGLPAQLPGGFTWRTEVPACLDWIATTPDAVAKVRETQQRRADDLFPLG